MDSLKSVIVVGGGAAGVSAAEFLRRQGYEQSLVLIGEEEILPYDRPPLSKQVLTGEWDAERTQLRTAEHYADLAIDVRHARAVGLDVDARTIALEDGSELGFDAAVLATGVRARRLPEAMHPAGVHVLRGHSDIAGLRAALVPGARLVVVGAGFLGMEVAASARSLDVDVTVVDPLANPMIRQVGSELGRLVAERHRERGVALKLGVGVEKILSENNHVSGVVLTDGTLLAADCVLVAIGSTPATEWLEGSSLTIGNGIECDEFCRAAPGIYAAGDVASWVNQRYGRRMRVEHRMNATEQGANVARNILQGDVEPFTPLPYFWTDQYDIKIQVHGSISGADDFTVEEGSFADNKFVGVYRTNGVLSGVLAWNMPAKLMRYRKQLLDQAVQV